MTVDYYLNIWHAHCLENFAADETITGKDEHESFAHVCGNIVHKCRDDNGCFSDNVFLSDINEARKMLKLCGAGVHRENRISERYVRVIVESAWSMLLNAQCLCPEAILIAS